jgi:hypothetical protein
VVCPSDGENDVVLYPPVTVEPPVTALYQSIVIPPGTEALKVTVPEPQRLLLLGLLGAAGNAVDVMLCDPVIATSQYDPSATVRAA